MDVLKYDPKSITPGSAKAVTFLNGSRRVSNGPCTPSNEHSGTSWPMSSFLLVNAALGAGVLNSSYVYDKAGGIYFTIFLQILIVATLVATMLILVYCAELTNTDTFHGVLLSMCGRWVQRLAALSILLTCYGICVSFLVLIRDQYNRLFLTLFGQYFCNKWYLNGTFTIPTTASFFILPMCYYKRMDFLRYASTLGISAMVYSVFLTIYEYFKLETEPGRMKTFPENATDVILVLPLISFSYQTHEIVVSTYSCMKEKTVRKFTKATFLAMGILFCIYGISGCFGYATFGSPAPPDVMSNYDASDPAVLVGMGALIMKMITTYPQAMLCGREAFNGLYADIMNLTAEQLFSGKHKRRIIITNIWFVTTVLLAVFTPTIVVILELLGCLASMNIFIFPGLCLFALAFREKTDFKHWQRILFVLFSSVILIYGIFICVVVFVRAFESIIEMEVNTTSTNCH